jgi:hypothetical protein
MLEYFAEILKEAISRSRHVYIRVHFEEGATGGYSGHPPECQQIAVEIKLVKLLNLFRLAGVSMLRNIQQVPDPNAWNGNMR